jgi:hypothetical protein
VHEKPDLIYYYKKSIEKYIANKKTGASEAAGLLFK